MPYEIETTFAELAVTLKAAGPDAQRPTEMVPGQPGVIIFVDRIKFAYWCKDGRAWDLLTVEIAGSRMRKSGGREPTLYQLIYSPYPAMGNPCPAWLLDLAEERRPVGVVDVPTHTRRIDSS